MSKGDGDTVSLGGVLTSLMTAGVLVGATAAAGVSLLVFRADAVDVRVERLEAKQRTLSESVAVLVRESQWTNAQLSAMLTAQGVAIPAPPPLRRATR